MNKNFVKIIFVLVLGLTFFGSTPEASATHLNFTGFEARSALELQALSGAGATFSTSTYRSGAGHKAK